MADLGFLSDWGFFFGWGGGGGGGGAVSFLFRCYDNFRGSKQEEYGNVKLDPKIKYWLCVRESYILVDLRWKKEMRWHGSHRSWHIFFKDFSRTFEVHFQGLFKDFSLFFQTSIRKKKWWTFQIRHTETIWSWVSQEKWWCGGGEIWVCVSTFLDDLMYYGYNTASNNSAWKGGLGVLPQKIFIRISTKSCNSRQFWRVH